MAEQNLVWNPLEDTTPLPPNNLIVLTPEQTLTEEFLNIPAIYCPDMSEENWQRELEGAAHRALITRQFVTGQISPEDFIDGLADSGIHVYDALDTWENALSFSSKFQSGWR